MRGTDTSSQRGAIMIQLLAKLYSYLFAYQGRERRVCKRVLCASFLIALSVRRKAAKVGRRILLRGDVKVSRNTTIGEGCVINGMKVFGSGPVVIGDHCSFGPGLVIQTQNHDYDTGASLPYGDKFVCKAVRIGDCVWIGMNVMLLPGTTIGEGAVIQAGSVVHGTIPPLAIAGGNPAKVFAARDEKHYDELKAHAAYRMW